MSKVKGTAAARPDTGEAKAEATAEFLPFTRPAIDHRDIEAVVRVLESGWITSGPRVRELESAIAERTGAGNAVAVSSATAGMHLLLHALAVGPGDEVITPSMTWVSTVNLIRLSGATPVFVDIDRDTLMTEAPAIEAAITERTRLIVPVHFAGAPLDLAPIHEVARRNGIAVVEDSAHALGTEYRDEPVGRAGTGVFSLQAIKNVTTAEGGVICTDDDDLAERARRLRFHGLGVNAFDRMTNSRLPSAEVIEPGFKYNLPDMNACLALGQMERLDATNAKRESLAGHYRKAFAGDDVILPLGLPAYPHKHAWHLFVVRVEVDRLSIDRDQFMDELKQLGIGTGLHFRAVHRHEYYWSCAFPGQSDLASTEWNSDRLMTLPLFPGMRDSDVDRVVDAVRTVAGRFRK